MALQTSGQISLNDLHIEAGGVSGTECSFNDTDIRSIISVGDQHGNHAISLYYGASSEQAFTISSNQTNLNLETYLTNAGWNGSATAVVTINSGVWIISNVYTTAALTISNAFNNKLQLINNGIIMGKGGNGQYRQSSAGSTYGVQYGGDAVSNAATGVVFTNNSGAYLAGGGGGGAAGANDGGGNDMGSGGGGAGGGRGGPYPSSVINGGPFPNGGGINGYGSNGYRTNPSFGYGGGAGGGGGGADSNDGADGGGGGRRVDTISGGYRVGNAGKYNLGAGTGGSTSGTTRGAFGGYRGQGNNEHGGNGGAYNAAGSNGVVSGTDSGGGGGGGYGAKGGNGRNQTGADGGAAWGGVDWASVTNNGTIWGST